MKVDSTLFFCKVVMTSYTIGYEENDFKTTCAAKSSLRLDLNKTRNLTNEFRVQNYLANGRSLFIFIYFESSSYSLCTKSVGFKTVFKQKVKENITPKSN